MNEREGRLVVDHTAHVATQPVLTTQRMCCVGVVHMWPLQC